jgi:hypothetical protein
MNLFAGEPERIPLDETSWLEHFPGWLDRDAAASLLANLMDGGSVPEGVRADSAAAPGVVQAGGMPPHDLVDAEAGERLTVGGD